MTCPCSTSMSALVSGRAPPPKEVRFSTPATSTQSYTPAAIACQARWAAAPLLAQAFSTENTGGPEMPTRCSTPLGHQGPSVDGTDESRLDIPASTRST
jgi:hypothetical protein